MPALDAAWALAEGTAKFKLLLIYGKVGNGKSHLGFAACIRRKERKLRAKWQPFTEWFADLRREMGQKGGDAEAKMDALKEVPFLVLDDASTIFDSAWQTSRLVELVDYRYVRELPTILITNRDLITQTDGTGRKIEPFPAQVLSRFNEKGLGKTVCNEAGDYRPKKKAAAKG